MSLTLAKSLLKNGTKIGVGVGAIYVTVDQGIWSSSSSSNNAMDKFKAQVVPATTNVIKQVPSIDDVKYWCVGGWNGGVDKVFRGVDSLPTYITQTSISLGNKLRGESSSADS